MLNYEEFKNRLRLDLVDYGGASVFDFTTINRNNGKADAVLVSTGGNTKPTIYIKPLYEEYQKTLDYDRAIDTLIHFKDRDLTPENLEEEFLCLFSDKEEFLANVELMLVNFEMNSEVLVNYPHRQIMDLAVIYCIHRFRDNGEAFTVRINKNITDRFELSEVELWKRAYDNTLRLHKFAVKSLREVLFNMTDVINYPVFDDGFYILSNERGIHGSIAMIYPDLLEEVAEKLDSDLIIIPSSVHEVILLSTNYANYAGVYGLQSMVREVNNGCVEPHEILSYSVYYYDSCNNTITVMGTDNEDTEQIS